MPPQNDILVLENRQRMINPVPYPEDPEDTDESRPYFGKFRRDGCRFPSNYAPFNQLVDMFKRERSIIPSTEPLARVINHYKGCLPDSFDKVYRENRHTMGKQSRAMLQRHIKEAAAEVLGRHISNGGNFEPKSTAKASIQAPKMYFPVLTNDNGNTVEATSLTQISRRRLISVKEINFRKKMQQLHTTPTTPFFSGALQHSESQRMTSNNQPCRSNVSLGSESRQINEFRTNANRTFTPSLTQNRGKPNTNLSASSPINQDPMPQCQQLCQKRRSFEAAPSSELASKKTTSKLPTKSSKFSPEVAQNIPVSQECQRAEVPSKTKKPNLQPLKSNRKRTITESQSDVGRDANSKSEMAIVPSFPVKVANTVEYRKMMAQIREAELVLQTRQAEPDLHRMKTKAEAMEMEHDAEEV
ncbi:hypothetical protein BJ875DRAFT_497588 [Amylocarpus encephaloides]|uniref:Uncharacterized protein n=1 Tax=Amylocarpus encephaloides TaxID=45428 RepID=A0A9P7YER9_9HELO|nr:hypothetical protein BJ875DRAFT_497588 [Amylocarpus encephaloides]